MTCKGGRENAMRASCVKVDIDLFCCLGDWY